MTRLPTQQSYAGSTKVSRFYAAWVISKGIVTYRWQTKEANNALTVIALLVSLRVPIEDFLFRVVASLLLNFVVYLLNDYCDIDVDLAAPHKDTAKAQFLKDHKNVALSLLIGITGFLVILALPLSRNVSIAVPLAVAIIYLYSRWLKYYPILDLVAIFIWGFSMMLIGVPEGNRDALILAVLVGLLTMSFEFINLMRDHDSDAASGIRTTSVTFGRTTALWMLRGIIVLSGIFVHLTLHAPIGFLIVLGVFLRLKDQDYHRYWNKLRFVYGSVWGLLMARYFLDNWMNIRLPASIFG